MLKMNADIRENYAGYNPKSIVTRTVFPRGPLSVMDLHLTKDSVKMCRWFSSISTDVGGIKPNQKTYTFSLKSVCKGVPSLIVVPLVTQHGNRVLRLSKFRANHF